MKRIRQAIENLASAVAYAEEGRREDALALIDALRPIRASSHAKVILASSGPTFSDSSLTYMQGLMERMPCDILALTTEAKLKKAAPKSEESEHVRALRRMAQERGAICLHRTFSGELCQAVQNYCQLVRDVRFAVIQAREDRMAACVLPIPVFLVKA
ncbi:MAG: hypothetical protein PWQ57_3249 [Desulfovibrionales bacterium]|jgi:hypothetical protein|nr:hypothetical protein [Desulfovibrionales bacterium]